MDIVVYGKKDCKLCEAAKAKLRILDRPFTFVNLDDPGEGWAGLGVVEAMSWYMMWNTLPVFCIDGEFMTYPNAMRHLKGGTGEKGGQKP